MGSHSGGPRAVSTEVEEGKLVMQRELLLLDLKPRRQRILQ